MAYGDLTAKQQRFVDEYLVDLNATQAMIRAGYSPRTANEQGARLLAKASVQEAVRERMEARKRDTIASAEEVLEYLSGCLRDEEMHPQYRQKAAELLGKRYGLYSEALNIKSDNELRVSVVVDDGD